MPRQYNMLRYAPVTTTLFCRVTGPSQHGPIELQRLGQEMAAQAQPFRVYRMWHT